MVTIKCTQYQKGDIRRYLEYAKHKKYEDADNGVIKQSEAEYTAKVIDELLEIVKGKVVEDYFNVPSKQFRDKQGKKKNEGGKFWRKI